MKCVSHWRETAAPIIARVLKETEGQPESVIRKALRAAWPFGQYANHPLKIWRDEIRIQRGKKKLRPHPMQRKVESTSGQTEMFKEGK